MPEVSDRDALIDTSEVLFARRGVHGVSLREVTTAASVRNKSAVQYHFGGRDGLVQAVLARRGEVLRVRRAMMLEELVLAGVEHDRRALCRAIVEPYCAFLHDGEGALCYLVVAREVLSDPQHAYEDLPVLFSDPLLPALLERLLRTVDLPGPVAAERGLVVVSSVIGATADRARRQLDETSPRPISPISLFVSNLVDMLDGAIATPSHHTTLGQSSANTGVLS